MPQCQVPRREETNPLERWGGLYLQVPSTGNKRWFLSVRIGGAPTRMALGVYPHVSLKDARAKAADIKAQKARGENPLQERRRQRQQQQDDTFADIAERHSGEMVWRPRARLERAPCEAAAGIAGQ